MIYHGLFWTQDRVMLDFSARDAIQIRFTSLVDFRVYRHASAAAILSCAFSFPPLPRPLCLLINATGRYGQLENLANISLIYFAACVVEWEMRLMSVLVDETETKQIGSNFGLREQPRTAEIRRVPYAR